MANKNFERFINGTVWHFRRIGFEFEAKSIWMKVLLAIGISNMVIVILGQLMVLPFTDDVLEEKAASFSYLNYYFVSSGKIAALLYNRKTILETLNEFGQIYPTTKKEKDYNLQIYLKQSVLIQKILVGFFVCITPSYTLGALMLSITDLIRGGVFTYRLPLVEWLPGDIHGHWVLYIFVYIHQLFSSYMSASIILGLDLCLFSSLLQMCMHFDVINRDILNIEPDKSGKAEISLRKVIIYHQRVLRLADKLNAIFTPSVLFSLMSSSFILCFTGYQLLGDVSMVLVIRLVALLGYELKQVVITCFLGDKLMQISLKTAETIYEHKWYNGAPRYRRMVLMFLTRSQKSVALNIAGISDVSLQTLRAVMSMSYQIFTLLKTA